MTLPPAMIRTCAQLATAYAPGAFFTFEGGRGACISLPMRAEEADLPEITKAMIFEQIREFVQVWAERATARDPANGGPEPDVPMRLVLDRPFLGASDQVEVGRQDITFVTPNQIGYRPQPLSFACRRCGLIKTCNRPEKFDEFIKKRQIGCPAMVVKRPCADDWEQLDVMFMHWSGGWDPISPAEQRLTSDNRIVLDQSCRFCGHEHFRLIRAGQQFSQWYFECANGACRGRRELRQQDYDTLSLIGQSVITGGGHLRGEINMEPIFYRASPTHYVHGDRLLVFSDSSLFDLLQGARQNDLVRFLAQQFGYPLRNMDDAERERLLRQAGREQE